MSSTPYPSFLKVAAFIARTTAGDGQAPTARKKESPSRRRQLRRKLRALRLRRRQRARPRIKKQRHSKLKALLQRVSKASVSVADEVVGQIGQGLVVFLGISTGDTEQDARYLAEKTVGLRIFPDSEGRFNLSALDTSAELLVVSQFTLLADTRKGKRPSFTEAAKPEEAEALFERFLSYLRSSRLRVASGLFQQHMLVEIHNDGPVTILLDSTDKYPKR